MSLKEKTKVEVKEVKPLRSRKGKIHIKLFIYVKHSFWI
jgi:hypothetical protein